MIWFTWWLGRFNWFMWDLSSTTYCKIVVFCFNIDVYHHILVYLYNVCYFLSKRPSLYSWIQGVKYLEFKEVQGLKLSPHPGPDCTNAFVSLRDLHDVLKSVETHGKVAEVLNPGLPNTCNINFVEVLEKFQKLYDNEVDSLKQKVKAQSDLMCKEVSDMGLPVYEPSEETPMEALDKTFLKSEAATQAVKVAKKISNYVNAVQKCCVDLACLNIDTSECVASMVQARSFVYSYTMVTVLHSPLWKSVTKETAAKKDSRQWSICNDAVYTVKQAKVDKAELPECLLNRCSQLLAKAEMSLPWLHWMACGS